MKLCFVTIMVLATFGCTHTQLRLNSVKQSATNVDIHFQQIVDNLAMFSNNPNVLPRFAMATAGSNQVSDTISGSTTESYSRLQFTGWGFTIGGNRVMNQNWSLKPVVESDRLSRIRCAFQIVVGALDPYSMDQCQCMKCMSELGKMGILPELPAPPDPPVEPIDPGTYMPTSSDADYNAVASAYHDTLVQKYNTSKVTYRQLLAEYNLKSVPDYHRKVEKYIEEVSTKIDCPLPRGWFCVAECWRDVPVDACYVGKNCGRYVYVMPDGMDALSRFTLTVMTLASADPVSPAVEVVRRVDPSGKVLEYKITTKERISKQSAVPAPPPTETEKKAPTFSQRFGSAIRQAVEDYAPAPAPSAKPSPQAQPEIILPSGQPEIMLRRDGTSEGELRSLIQLNARP